MASPRGYFHVEVGWRTGSTEFGTHQFDHQSRHGCLGHLTDSPEAELLVETHPRGVTLEYRRDRTVDAEAAADLGHQRPTDALTTQRRVGGHGCDVCMPRRVGGEVATASSTPSPHAPSTSSPGAEG